MAISVRPAVEGDLPKVASALMEAENAHPIVALPWASPEVAHQFFLANFKSRFPEPLNHILVATDSDGEVAGYLMWQDPGKMPPLNFVFPEGTKEKVFQTWQAAQANKEEFRTGNIAELSALAIFPHYQGQGVGSALVKYCVEQLDSKHLSCLVVSSVAGKRLYEKNNFSVVKQVTANYSEFGREPLHVTYIMKRDAV